MSSLIIAGICVRSWLMFSTLYIPGINGAYYLVQTRALLDHGHLAVPDLPLTFHLQALFAWLIQHLAGCSQHDGILMAVKVMDTVVPPLVALPVFLVVRTISRDRWLPLMSALVVLVGAPALSMVGDFQKNSLALVWMAAFIWSVLCWEAKRRTMHGCLAILFLGLAGVTHIGVFGATLALGISFLVARWIHGERSDWRIFWRWGVLAVTVVGIAALLVLWGYDPHRVQRLGNAILHPVAFLSPKGHPGPGPMVLVGSGGPVGPGGPPGFGFGFGFFSWLPCLIGCTLSLLTISLVWLRHKDLDLAICCVMGACAGCGLILTGPWVSGDLTMRFGLNAVIPLTICGAFCADQIWSYWRLIIPAAVTLLVVAPSVPILMRGGEPIITQQALAELQAMAPQITAPQHCLVVARHGLEWWSSWILGTHLSQAGALRPSDWTTYQNVYFLHQKSGMNMPGPPMAGMLGIPGPPMPGQLPGDHPPFPGPPPGDHGGPFRDLQIPASATIVHDGPCFTLARIPLPISAP